MLWDGIRGHDEIISRLHRAAAANRLAHAYLMVGPHGVGKRLLAQRLAQTVLCDRSDPQGDWRACNRCPGCTYFRAGTHPDFYTLQRPEDKLEFPKELVVTLRDHLSLKPVRSARKVAILDDADDLNDESSNAFLKTLEEPPPGSMLILVGSSLERQLPTIRSRCQLLVFAPLNAEDVLRILRDQPDAPEQPDPLLVQLSLGSPGLMLAYREAKLDTWLPKWLDAMSQPNVATVRVFQGIWEIVEAAGKEAGPQRRRASLIVQLLLAVTRLARYARAGVIEAHPAIAQWGARCGERRLLAMQELLLEADMHVDRRVQLVLAMERLNRQLVKLLVPQRSAHA